MGLSHDHAGQKSTEREGDTEQLRGAVGDAHRRRDHAQREQLARAGAGNLAEQPREDPSSDHQHEGDEDRNLPYGDHERFQQAPVDSFCVKLTGAAAQPSGQQRQQHKNQNHRQILDDQPADRDPTVDGLEQATPLQCPDEYDSAGHGKGQAEHDACPQAPTPESGDARTEGSRNHDLNNCAGHGDATDSQQIIEGEVQPDTEHQQDDADLGQLARQFDVSHETWRGRAEHDPGNQVANQRRQFQSAGDETHNQRKPQAGGNGGD